MKREMVDVTSNHRPDTAWVHVDPAGHEHRWYTAAAVGDPIVAARYSPLDRYVVQSLRWVKDGDEYWDGDDEPHEIGHLECKQCGSHVTPRYRADDTRQMMPGLTEYQVDGVTVDKPSFDLALAIALRGVDRQAQ